MRRLLLALLILLGAVDVALAAGSIPLSFFGYTKTYHGQPNTEISVPAGSSRDWVVCNYSQGCGSAFVGGTGYPRGANCLPPPSSNAGWVSATSTEPTAHTFVYTALDAVINDDNDDNDDISHRRDPMHVFFGMNPNWMTGLSGTNACAGVPTNIADLDEHVLAVAAHLKGRVHRYEGWNEPTATAAGVPLFYSGTVPQLVTFEQHIHDDVLSVDPSAILTSPSFTGWGGTSVTLVANGYYSGVDYFKAFIDAGGGPTFSELNVHAYPTYNSTLNCGQNKCPEQLFSLLEWYQNVLNYAGMPNAPIDITEFDSDAGGTTATDPAYIAMIYIIASAKGVNEALEYTSDECALPSGTYGCLLGPTAGMNAAALAVKTVESELLGSTWTAPFARVPNTNRIVSTMTGGTPGTIGCGTPTGTMPSGMGSFTQECTHGVILSYVGAFTINGVLLNRFSIVGTNDRNAGINIYLNSSIADGTTVQYTWWTQSQCIGLSPVAGNTAANVVTNIQIADLGTAGAFLSSQGVFGMTLTSARADTQCWHGIPVQMVSAGTLQIRSSIGIAFNLGVPINEYVDIPAGPTYATLDNGTTYQGDFTKADGSAERVVSDVSSYTGSNGTRVTYSTPAQYNYTRGLDGVEYPIVGNSIVLSNSPVFLRVAKQPIF